MKNFQKLFMNKLKMSLKNSVDRKRIDFLGTKDLVEITKMLNDEVKIKKSKDLQNTVGF